MVEQLAPEKPHTMTPDDDVDDEDHIDDEEIWTTICSVAAEMAGISAEQAKAILEAEGFHAYGHTGIAEAVEIVRLATSAI